MRNEERNREWLLFLGLALAGVVTALFNVEIPHTDVVIDGRLITGFMGFALLRRWWAALALAALLSYPYGSPDLPLWIAFGVNLLYAVPSLLAIRPLSGWLLRRYGPGWQFGIGWLALTLLCYQVIITPVLWGVLALLTDRAVMQGIVEGWRTQPYLIESVLVGLLSAAGMVAILALKQLRAAERRNQALLDYSPVCHKIVDLDFNLQYMSGSGFKMLQLDDNAEVYGKPYPFEFFPIDFRENMRAAIEQVIASGEARVLEGLTNNSKGNSVWLYSTLVPVFKDDAELDFITIVSADMTKEKRLKNDLLHAQKMESVGRLAGGVAHDFNNMLNVILGHAELALEDLAEDSPLRTDLDEIRKAAERSANLTRQLLAFARRQTVAPKVLDLNEAIASMLKMLERLIGEDIDLLWKPGMRLAQVRIDPSQVDQMLANLAVNARDAIGDDNGRITIETAAVRFDEAYCDEHTGFTPGDYIMLAVSDNGCGMDEETRANIFEPFFTTKGVGEGTGLGLAMIYGIVKQNNGFINLYSEPGTGTTFCIYFPALGEASVSSTGEMHDSEAADRGDETVLIVEDQSAVLNLAKKILERLGYTVLTALSPGEALSVARDADCKIDLLITDVVMPEMNGRVLAEKLEPLCPGIKKMFMSGYTANVIAHQGVLDEGVQFIQKPFSQRDLAKKVREALAS